MNQLQGRYCLEIFHKQLIAGQLRLKSIKFIVFLLFSFWLIIDKDETTASPMSLMVLGSVRLRRIGQETIHEYN